MHHLTSKKYSSGQKTSIMKKTLFLLIFSLSIFYTALAQQKPDSFKVYGLPIDTLKTMVQKHPKYFDHLKNKWLKTPAKMTADDMMLLYYGSAFMTGYDPVKEDKAVEKIARHMAEFDFENAVKEGEKLVDVYPLNSRLYMLLGYAYKKMGLPVKSKFYYKKYGDLLRVPLYSGQGKNFDDAYVVRIISDEYLILNQQDLELVQQEVRYSRQLPFDVLSVKPKSKENKRFTHLPKDKCYFNIYLPYFIGQHKTYKNLQEEAKRKYKVTAPK